MTFSSYCKTSRGKPKQILLITMLCVTLFSTLQMQTVEAAFEDLGLDFDEIHIVTSVSEKSIERSLNIFSANNVTGMTGFSSDLIEVNNRQNIDKMQFLTELQ